MKTFRSLWPAGLSLRFGDPSNGKAMESQFRKHIWFARFVVSVGTLSVSAAAFADEGLAGFGHVNAEPPAAIGHSAPAPRNPGRGRSRPTKGAASKPANAAPVDTDPWGPTPIDKISLANLAPGLLAYFNNGPVFGLPGTVTGDFWHSTQISGDWGGVRTDLARHGVFLDLYTTSSYQDVMAGGLKTGSSFVQNSQLSLNIDTGRAGLWSGGLLHFTAQSRYGDLPQDTFTAGVSVPLNVGLALPGPFYANSTLPSEYYLVQALTKQVSVVLGKISDIFIPDQTLFGNSFKYDFANFNFNKNPITTNFYNPTALAALGVWAPSPKFAIAGGVLDPNSQSDTFAAHAFDKVNLYLTSIASYDIAGLPGQFSPAFNWSNKQKLDLTSPFGQLGSLAEYSQAAGALLGVDPTSGLPANFENPSWFAIANVSQYLYVKDDPATIAQELKSGQPLRGVGVFARAGYAPAETNTITRDASVALFAHGLLDARPYDSFGVGFYYNAISNGLKTDIAKLTAGTASVNDEMGTEVFYDFAITPAIRLSPGYQHIWNPLTAEVAAHQKSADIFLGRLTLSW
jgi:hypothetical protein